MKAGRKISRVQMEDYDTCLPHFEAIEKILNSTDIITLFKEFAENIKKIETGKYYYGSGDVFCIRYLDYIISDRTGSLHITPMRIHLNGEFIEVSKQRLDQYRANTNMIIFMLIQCYALNLTAGSVTKADMIAIDVMKKLNLKFTPKDAIRSLAPKCDGGINDSVKENRVEALIKEIKTT